MGHCTRAYVREVTVATAHSQVSSVEPGIVSFMRESKMDVAVSLSPRIALARDGWSRASSSTSFHIRGWSLNAACRVPIIGSVPA